jgi:uncharacterized membrane protein YcaP (DUF421 family)
MYEQFAEWTFTSTGEVMLVIFSAAVTYAAILFYTRLVGLRSFSKMSASDFAMTIAVGSLFGSTISTSRPPLLAGLVAIAALFGGQWLLANLRRQSPRVATLVDNKPILLMAGPEILQANMDKANVTRDDLFAKLRESNALTYDDVLAVVFETTGDITVLHRSDSNQTLEPDFVADVVGHDLLFK